MSAVATNIEAKPGAGLCSELTYFDSRLGRFRSNQFASPNQFDNIGKLPSQVRNVIEQFLAQQILDLPEEQMANYSSRLMTLITGATIDERPWLNHKGPFGSLEFRISEYCAERAKDLRGAMRNGQLAEVNDDFEKAQDALALAMRILSGKFAEIAPENLRKVQG